MAAQFNAAFEDASKLDKSGKKGTATQDEQLDVSGSDRPLIRMTDSASSRFSSTPGERLARARKSRSLACLTSRYDSSSTNLVSQRSSRTKYRLFSKKCFH